MKTSCATCRWVLTYRCGCVEDHCRFYRPEWRREGYACRKWRERPPPETSRDTRLPL